MDQKMQYSSNGPALTEQFEGCELTAFQDSGAVWINGYGNTRGMVPGSTDRWDRCDGKVLAGLLRRRQAAIMEFAGTSGTPAITPA